MVVSFEATGEPQEAGRSWKWSLLPITLTREESTALAGGWYVSEETFQSVLTDMMKLHQYTWPLLLYGISNYTALLT